MAHLQYQQNINISLNDILKLMPQLDAKELELFLSEAAVILADLKTPKVDKQEVELLLKINNWIVPKTEQRYEELRAKMRENLITKAEHEELLKLVNIVELQNAERISNLYTLSKIRNTSLDELMKDLGITAIGRATEKSLKLNRPGIINLRRVCILDKTHPPKD